MACERANIAVGVSDGVFIVVETQMLVAFRDGTAADIFVGKRIAGIPQVDSVAAIPPCSVTPKNEDKYIYNSSIYDTNDC